MLVMIFPDQVPDLWPAIKYSVEKSLPPIVATSPEVANNVLMSLLDGSAQCWMDYEMEGEENKLFGIGVTTVVEDTLSNTRSLLLYTVFGVRPLANEVWIGAFKTIRKYAKANRCSKIIAYSNLDRVEETAKLVGGNVEWKLISFPV